MKLKFSLLLLFSVIIGPLCNGQELNCNVEVNSQKVQGNEPVFTALQEAVNEYMNSTKFTPYQFSANEKIECRLFFTVNDYSNDIIKGELQVQSMRPVYNSSYNANLVNLKDKEIEFEYKANDRLIFSESNIESDLTALLDYYAYLIIAIDFDSFSPEGGGYCYERLQSIVQMSQSSGRPGWKTFADNRNRAAVLAAFTDPGTRPLRNLYYEYHRKGLDEMALLPEKGRAAITSALAVLGQIQEKAPMSVALTLWHDAKLDEIVNIYSQGQQAERNTVYDLLERLYPTDQIRLQAIKNPPETR